MEDVKEHQCKNFWDLLCLPGFNPCFNGRCKRTACGAGAENRIEKVSILVLMEDVKEQLFPA